MIEQQKKEENQKAYEQKYFKIHRQKRNKVEDMLVYQALRDQKKMELMMKVRELRHV